MDDTTKPFKDRLCTWIDLVDKWLEIPHDESQLSTWTDAAAALATAYEFMDDEQPAVDAVVAAWAATFRRTWTTPAATQAHMDALLAREQIEQRTPAWYAQTAVVISASELSTLFGPPRARAQLVMAKTALPALRPQIHARTSASMGPFDWGIRFEPVVKQIYCHLYQAEIKELGRLTDLEDTRVTASPDGLVYTGPRAGRLIEIKCPVTREPDGSVPKDYYVQMQLQMRVTGCEACDYVEAQFVSPYSKELGRIGPGQFCGEIALIYDSETTDMRYEYGPLQGAVNPTIGENEMLLERIPWSLYSWQEQVVRRAEGWWAGVKPVIDAFWEDVERAKRGEFVVPEARPRKAAAAAVCEIQLPAEESASSESGISACASSESTCALPTEDS